VDVLDPAFLSFFFSFPLQFSWILFLLLHLSFRFSFSFRSFRSAPWVFRLFLVPGFSFSLVFVHCLVLFSFSFMGSSFLVFVSCVEYVFSFVLLVRTLVSLYRFVSLVFCVHVCFVSAVLTLTFCRSAVSNRSTVRLFYVFFIHSSFPFYVLSTVSRSVLVISISFLPSISFISRSFSPLFLPFLPFQYIYVRFLLLGDFHVCVLRFLHFCVSGLPFSVLHRCCSGFSGSGISVFVSVFCLFSFVLHRSVRFLQIISRSFSCNLVLLFLHVPAVLFSFCMGRFRSFCSTFHVSLFVFTVILYRSTCFVRFFTLSASFSFRRFSFRFVFRSFVLAIFSFRFLLVRFRSFSLVRCLRSLFSFFLPFVFWFVLLFTVSVLFFLSAPLVRSFSFWFVSSFTFSVSFLGGIFTLFCSVLHFRSGVTAVLISHHFRFSLPAVCFSFLSGFRFPFLSELIFVFLRFYSF